VPDGPASSFPVRTGESGGRDARAPKGAFLRDLERRFQRLEESARADLLREHLLPQSVREATAERRLDARYAGQAYELSVPFTPRFAERFHREHEKAYGHASPGRTLEIVNLRVRLVVPTPQPGRLRARRDRQRSPASVATARAAIAKRKPVWFQDRAWMTPFYNRQLL